ncbi:MAG TPA: Gfo/Idh/MocA family oxidoreductase [Acidimicrobiales bacterium]|nr:Gfo/Idh/MocA family oxidoreductase [Acidimicrobiales bacterium]
MTLRAAVVGTSFGGRIHVPALRAAGFDVVALVGQDEERTTRRAARLEVERACTSLAQALELGLDAVSVAGPPASHAPLTLEALAGRCHVLCEKPFTLTVAEAEELRSAAEAASLVGLIGHEFRWATDRAVAEEALAEGRIGTPVLVVAVSLMAMLRQFTMADWWYDEALGGGWLGASGSHLVDHLRGWFGDLASVSAVLTTVQGGLGVDDGFAVRATTASGVEAVLVQCAAALGPGEAMTRVVGTDGTLWLAGGQAWLADGDSAEGRPLGVPSHLELPDVSELATGSLADMTRLELPPYIRLAEAFRRRIEGAEPAPGPAAATFADGVAVMQVLEAVRASAAAGGRTTPVGSPVGGAR